MNISRLPARFSPVHFGAWPIDTARVEKGKLLETLKKAGLTGVAIGLALAEGQHYKLKINVQDEAQKTQVLDVLKQGPLKSDDYILDVVGIAKPF